MRVDAYPASQTSDPPIAKDIALAGVKSVTIHDPEPTTVEDLGTQVILLRFYIVYSTDDRTVLLAKRGHRETAC